jgi:hypothetical protein
MDHTFVDDKSLKTLEDYAVFLTGGLISLMTLQNIQVKAIELGIMPEDLNERANTIIWDVRRQIQLYQHQLNSVLELLPDDFSAMNTLKKLQADHIKKSKSLTRKPRKKKCDT